MKIKKKIVRNGEIELKVKNYNEYKNIYFIFMIENNKIKEFDGEDINKKR